MTATPESSSQWSASTRYTICSSEPLGMMRARTASADKRSASCATSAVRLPIDATSDSYGKTAARAPRAASARVSSSVCHPVRAARMATNMRSGLLAGEGHHAAGGKVRQVAGDGGEARRGGTTREGGFGVEPELGLTVKRGCGSVEVARKLHEHGAREADFLCVFGHEREVDAGVVFFERCRICRVVVDDDDGPHESLGE